MRLIWASAAILFANAACAQQGQDIGTMPIDDSFLIEQLDTSRMVPITIAINMVPVEGRIAVCAAFQSQSTSYLPQLKRAFYVTEGTTTIMNGLGWAAQIRPGQPLIGQEANCRLTDAPAVESPQLGIGLRRTTF